MQKRRLIWILLPLFVAALLLNACSPLRQPAPQSGAPQIPQQIAKGNRQEPMLKVYVKDTKQIKEMKLEDYVTGVVAAEMEPNWPLEALAAQAILARTFTLQKIAQEGGVPARNADASTDIEEFQAYDASRINNTVKEAVRRTRGMVAAYNSQFIRAWFHANSGGKTANAVEGLGFDKAPTPYVISIDDPISMQAAPANQQYWTATFTKQQVKQAVQKVGPNVGDFQSVQVTEKGPSGRATKITIGSTVVSGPALRLALGSTKMRSTLIDSITVSGDSVTFKGKGYGHGVGMSQWGAKGRAEQGAKAEDIVKAYFKDIKLFKIWD
jgi:stage II sporulation protein D